MRTSRTYPFGILGLLFTIGLSLFIAACAPSPAFPAPPKQAKRCIVLVGASWCGPCQAIQKNVLPGLKSEGLKVAEFRDKADADIHLFDVDTGGPDPRPGWGITDGTIPLAIVFEDGKQIDKRSGQLSAADFRTLLARENITQSENPAPIAKADEAVPESKTTWDQLVEFIGQDTAILTLTIPNGRNIQIPEARAAVTMPSTVTANVKVVSDSLQVVFDKPLIKAEAKRLGIRIGTEIPSVNFAKDKIVAKTALGIPFIWKLTTHPFGSGVDVPGDAAGK